MLLPGGGFSLLCDGMLAADSVSLEACIDAIEIVSQRGICNHRPGGGWFVVHHAP